MTARTVDIVIIGGGMVGLCAASLLSRSGFETALVEASAAPDFDPSSEPGLRVSALSKGSVNILKQAGAWRQIEQNRHCRYLNMHVEEARPTGDGPAIDFNAAEFALDCLGTIVENDLVQWSLWQTLEALGTVDLICPNELVDFRADDQAVSVRLRTGEVLRCSLLVGADGPASKVRQIAGVAQTQWVYGQRGLVAVVRCERDNPGTAWQRFVGGNPLAFLPLSDGCSSIVWTLAEEEAERLLNVEDADFHRELTVASDAWLGRVVASGPRAAFPLGMRLSHAYRATRTVIVGDAAHVVHPMTGQGVNIGLQDVAALVEVLVEARAAGSDPGEERALQRYSRWRRSESEIMAHGIQGIKDLFAIPMLGPLRKMGLKVVSSSWVAREAFIRRATGLHANAPELSRGKSLSDLVHSSNKH